MKKGRQKFTIFAAYKNWAAEEFDSTYSAKSAQILLKKYREDNPDWRIWIERIY
ncbi:MAG: hypothetical protein GY861_00400 [bacterium]|nr:hypothetical protein [bacterium]